MYISTRRKNLLNVRSYPLPGRKDPKTKRTSTTQQPFLRLHQPLPHPLQPWRFDLQLLGAIGHRP